MSGRTSLLLFFLFAVLARGAFAGVKWNVKAAVQYKADTRYVEPGSDDAKTCTDPGICVPATVTIPNNTLWYWCGWSSTQMTQQLVTGKNNVSVTTQLMRWNQLWDCVLKPGATWGFQNISQCEIIFNSRVGPSVNPNLYLSGLAFSDEICLCIANNEAKNVTLSFQFYQWTDWARYYGTVFSVILWILLLVSIVSYVGYTVWHEYHSPSDRIKELRSFEQQLERSTTILGHKDNKDDPEPGSFGARVQQAMRRVKNMVKGKGASQV